MEKARNATMINPPIVPPTMRIVLVLECPEDGWDEESAAVVEEEEEVVDVLCWE